MKPASIVFLIVVAAAAFLVWPRRIEQFRQGAVSGGEIRSPVSSIVAHSSRNYYLAIDRATFSHVLGERPYFIPLDKIGAILFVTKNGAQGSKIHIVYLGTRKHIAVEAGNILFGPQIGSNRKPDQPMTDYIESVTPTKVVLVTQGLRSRERFDLDLTLGRLSKVGEELINY